MGFETGIGDLDWGLGNGDLGMGIGIEIENWVWGQELGLWIRIGIKIGDRDYRLRSGNGFRDWDWRLPNALLDMILK